MQNKRIFKFDFYFAQRAGILTLSKFMKILLSLILYLFLLIDAFNAVTSSVRDLVQPLVEIKKNGTGNKFAVHAWPKVADLPTQHIPELLDAMNLANPLGDNWIRAAISKISDNRDSTLPIDEIIQFLNNYSNHADSRVEAFRIIQSSHPDRAELLIPGFLDDPVMALRREAVAKKLSAAKEETNKSDRINLYNDALSKAREVDQISEASKALKADGVNVNMRDLMGFVVNWQTIGPFDNTGRKGFNLVYPPEQKINYNATYEGKNDSVKWSPLSTNDELGLININEQYGEIKEVAAYAHVQFASSKNTNVQFRIGSKNAWKLWVNGKLLFARDEYHRGKTRIDQFVIDGKLKAGNNDILIKVCQNEQTQSWTKQWEFNFRVTDQEGTAIHSAN